MPFNQLKPYDFVFCPTEDLGLCYVLPDRGGLDVNDFNGNVWFACDPDGKVPDSEIRHVFPATEEMRSQLNDLFGVELPDILPGPLMPFRHAANFEAVKRLFLDTIEATRAGRIPEFLDGVGRSGVRSLDLREATDGARLEDPEIQEIPDLREATNGARLEDPEIQDHREVTVDYRSEVCLGDVRSFPRIGNREGYEAPVDFGDPVTLRKLFH